MNKQIWNEASNELSTAIDSRLNKTLNTLTQSFLQYNKIKGSTTSVGKDNELKTLKQIHDAILDIGKNYKGLLNNLNNVLSYNYSANESIEKPTLKSKKG